MDTYVKNKGKVSSLALITRIFVFTATFLAPQQVQADIQKNTSAAIRQIVKNTDAPSLSVAAAYRGELIVAVAEGLADKGQSIKAGIDTQYRTGSIAKVIGVTGFMKLIEQQKVGLFDPVRRYLPYLPAHYQDINLIHLMTHTSGIRHYRYGEYGTNIAYPSLREATKVFRDSKLLFSPGTDYQYSTYGINLIQGVIEKVTAKPLDQYLKKVLFTPAQLAHTELEIKGQEKASYAVGYRSFFKNTPVKDIDVSNKYIGGGMRSTPSDLVKLVAAIEYLDYLPEPIKRKMLSVPLPKAASDRGLGWRFIEYQGQPAYGHGGAVNGFESYLMHFINEEITVAVMVNQDSYDHTSSTLYKVYDLVKAYIANEALPKAAGFN